MHNKKKIVVAICWITILLFINIVNAGLYPTFDGNRSLWVNMVYYGTPIVVDPGVSLGLTNPDVGIFDYNFQFHIVKGDIEFNIPSPLTEGVLIFVDNYDLFMTGSHDGPGSPVSVDAVNVNGYGTIQVYDYSIYQGEFTVIPEPATIFIFLIGTILCRKK